MNELEKGFREVEKRVRALAGENRDLRRRISELEQELEGARRVARESEQFHGKKLHITEKLEQVLRALEAVGEKK